MSARRSFLKSLGIVGVPLLFAFPFIQIKRKNAFSFKTITFLKIPTKHRNFSKIEDLLTNSTNSNYWKAFRTIKSRFMKQNKLFQPDRIALDRGLFVIPTYYKTKRDCVAFETQVNVALLKKEFSKENIQLHIKTIG